MPGCSLVLVCHVSVARDNQLDRAAGGRPQHSIEAFAERRAPIHLNDLASPAGRWIRGERGGDGEAHRRADSHRLDRALAAAARVREAEAVLSRRRRARLYGGVVVRGGAASPSFLWSQVQGPLVSLPM